MAFTEEHSLLAAEWWAQQLIGGKQHKTKDFAAITHSLLSRYLSQGSRHDDDFWDDSPHRVTQEQYNDFITVLAGFIRHVPAVPTDDGKSSCKEIGHSSVRQLPELVKEAAIAAQIPRDATLTLPSYMAVMENGQLHTGSAVIAPAGAPHPINLHTLDPSQAPYVVDAAEPEKILRVIEIAEPSTIGSGRSVQHYAKGDWMVCRSDGTGYTLTAEDAVSKGKRFYLTQSDGTALSREEYYPGKPLAALGQLASKAAAASKAGDMPTLGGN